MKIWLTTVISILFSFLTFFSRAECPSRNLVVGDSLETLKLVAYYNLGAIWIKGGEAIFTAKREGSYYHYTAKAYTYPKWRKIYDMNTSLEAYMSVSDLKPVSYASNTKEEGHTKSEKYTFFKDGTFKYQVWKDGAEPETYTGVRPDCAYDMLNQVYASRDIDLDSVPFGQDMSFLTYFDQNVSELHGHVVCRENITTRSGHKYSCLKCMTKSIPGSIFDPTSPVYVWVTDDNRHIPVYVQCKIKLGSIKVYYEPDL